MTADGDRLTRLEMRVEELDRRATTHEAKVEVLAERQSSDMTLMRGDVHNLRLDFAKLSTKVLVAATLVAPVLVAVLNGLVKKLWG